MGPSYPGVDDQIVDLIGAGDAASLAPARQFAQITTNSVLGYLEAGCEVGGDVGVLQATHGYFVGLSGAAPAAEKGQHVLTVHVGPGPVRALSNTAPHPQKCHADAPERGYRFDC
jgi:hypothetical protein